MIMDKEISPKAKFEFEEDEDDDDKPQNNSSKIKKKTDKKSNSDTPALDTDAERDPRERALITSATAVA